MLLLFSIVAVCAVLTISAGSAGMATGDAPWGFSLTNLDRTCKPCDDFYQFAMGGWMKANTIPAEYSSWGSFTVLRDKNLAGMRAILESAANSKPAPGSNTQKIGDFYSSCMDTTAIDAAGSKPLAAGLAAITAIQDRKGLDFEIARLHREVNNVAFGFGATPDFKNSSQMIAIAHQGGLGMPDRDYYLRDDEKSRQLRDGYLQHVAKMFELAGDAPDTAVTEAKTVMALETSLAKASRTRVELRDPEKNYNKMTLAELKKLTPDWSWEAYMQAVGSPSVAEINIGQPDFFKELDHQLSTSPLADWKVYLRWHVIHDDAPALSEAFVQENFNFYGKQLSGTTELQPRWKRCAQAANQNLGEALGQIYVQKYFPPEAKARAKEMVNNLIAALRSDIPTLSWMGPDTKTQALAKLEAFNVKIGYPDKWRDYSKLTIDRGSYLRNVRRSQEFEENRELEKIGKPVDRSEWGMTPPTVNAYYNATFNEIVFPAGILQPPFYDPNADDALNYGGMGAVIGHEISHGFDDRGSQFDGQGNLRNWWTPDDRKNFDERGQCIVGLWLQKRRPDGPRKILQNLVSPRSLLSGAAAKPPLSRPQPSLPRRLARGGRGQAGNAG